MIQKYLIQKFLWVLVLGIAFDNTPIRAEQNRFLTITQRPSGTGSRIECRRDFGGITCGVSGSGAVDCRPATEPVNCAGRFSVNDIIHLKVIPATGFEFQSLTGAECQANSPVCDINMRRTSSQTVSVIATFRPPRKINVSILPTGSPIEGSVGCVSGISTNCLKLPGSGAVTLTATPAPGFSFDAWSSFPTLCLGSTNPVCTLPSTFSFTMVTAAAKFIPNRRVNVNIIPSETPAKGSVSCSSGTSTNCTSLPARGEVKLTATPASGFTFDSWVQAPGSCLRSADPVCIIPAGFNFLNTAVTAAFIPNRSVSVSIIPSGDPAKGIVSCASGATTSCASLPPRGEVRLTATPASGFTFDSWVQAPGSCPRSADPVCIIPAGFNFLNTAVTAAFIPNRSVSVSIIPTGDPAKGNVSCASGSSTSCALLPPRGEVKLTATPASGFSFDSWVQAPGSCLRSADPVCNIPEGFNFSNAAVTAAFIPNRSIIAKVIPPGPLFGGTLTCLSGNSTDCANLGPKGEVKLKATPAAGFSFDRWVNAPGACNMSTKMECIIPEEFSFLSLEVTAAFLPNRSVTVSVLPPTIIPSGQISCASGDSTNCASLPPQGEVRLSAVASEGYVFDRWIKAPGPCNGSVNPLCVIPKEFGFATLDISAVFAPNRVIRTVALPRLPTPPGNIVCASGSSSNCWALPFRGEVRLTATAANGFRFDRWINAPGACQNSTNSLCVIPESFAFQDLEVAAAFIEGVASTGIVINGDFEAPTIAPWAESPAGIGKLVSPPILNPVLVGKVYNVTTGIFPSGHRNLYTRMNLERGKQYQLVLPIHAVNVERNNYGNVSVAVEFTSVPMPLIGIDFKVGGAAQTLVKQIPFTISGTGPVTAGLWIDLSSVQSGVSSPIEWYLDNILVEEVVPGGPSGTIDLAFGQNGSVQLAPPGALLTELDGKIVHLSPSNLSGTCTDDIALVRRLQPNGGIDPTFGDNGLAKIPCSEFFLPFQIAKRPDGKYLVMGDKGRFDSNNEIVFALFDSNGRLALEFGQEGILHTNIISDGPSAGDAFHESQPLAIQSDNRAVFIRNNRELRRISATGQLENNFGSNGFATVLGTAVAVLPDNRLVLAGFDGLKLLSPEGMQMPLPFEATPPVLLAKSIIVIGDRVSILGTDISGNSRNYVRLAQYQVTASGLNRLNLGTNGVVEEIYSASGSSLSTVVLPGGTQTYRSDNSFYVASCFSLPGSGTSVGKIKRLQVNGDLDKTFGTQFSGEITRIGAASVCTSPAQWMSLVVQPGTNQLLYKVGGTLYRIWQ